VTLRRRFNGAKHATEAWASGGWKLDTGYLDFAKVNFVDFSYSIKRSDMMKNYRELEVYQKSYALTLQIYKTTRTFPREELFGLTSQIKRAAYSIPLNIAEGYAKKASVNEFKRFIAMALGSSDEMQVILELCKDLDFISAEKYVELSSEYERVGKMLTQMLKVWK